MDLDHPPNIEYYPGASKAFPRGNSRLIHVYNEWLSGDHAWELQVGAIHQYSSLSANLFNLGSFITWFDVIRHYAIFRQDKHFHHVRQPHGTPIIDQSRQHRCGHSQQRLTSHPPSPCTLARHFIHSQEVLSS